MCQMRNIMIGKMLHSQDKTQQLQMGTGIDTQDYVTNLIKMDNLVKVVS